MPHATTPGEISVLQPLAIRTGGGRVLIGPRSMVPPSQRITHSPAAALNRIFHDRDAVSQLRRLWPQLEVGGDHHHQLTPPDMHDLMERAVTAHRIALLWIPPIEPGVIPVTIKSKPRAPPPAPGATPPAPAKPSLVPVGRMAIAGKIDRALHKSFDYIARDGRKGFKDFVQAIDTLSHDPVALTKIGAFCALLAIPGVGEAAGTAFLAYAYYLLGFHGASAALHFGAACVRAATATTDAEIDAAGREFADAFEDLGEAVIAWLLTRIQPVAAGAGGRAAAAEKEAALEVQAAKVIKPAESYQQQILSKYKAAKDDAKAAIAETKTAAVTGLKEALATAEDEAVFWSGKTGGVGGAEVAGRIAKAVDGTTLEQLMAERGVELPVWDAANPEAVAAWENASRTFAEEAKGNVTAVIGETLRPGNVWETIELPALMNNPAIKQITLIDPATGIKNIIFSR